MTQTMGRPSILTPDLVDHIIPFVECNLTVNQVAKLSKVPQPRLWTWLNRGKEDLINDIDSIYADFTIKFDEKLGLSAKGLLDQMKELKTFQSISWLLEKCFREDFGAEGPDIKLMKELFNELKPLMDKRKE